MSGLEMLQNSGKEAIIDLMESRIAIAEGQLPNRIDYDLYQDGTGNSSKNITGLAAAVGGSAGAAPRFCCNRFCTRRRRESSPSNSAHHLRT